MEDKISKTGIVHPKSKINKVLLPTLESSLTKHGHQAWNWNSVRQAFYHRSPLVIAHLPSPLTFPHGVENRKWDTLTAMKHTFSKSQYLVTGSRPKDKHRGPNSCKDDTIWVALAILLKCTTMTRPVVKISSIFNRGENRQPSQASLWTAARHARERL